MSLLSTVKVSKYFIKPAFILLALFELIAFYLSPFISAFTMVDNADLYFQDLSHLNVFAVVYAIVMSLLMVAMGNYQSEKYNIKRVFIFTCIQCCISISLSVMIGVFIYMSWPGLYPGYNIPILSLGISIGVVAVLRASFFKYIDHDEIKRKVLVFGAGDTANNIIEKYQDSNHECSFFIMGYVPIFAKEAEVSQSKIIHLPTECLYEYAHNHKVEEIIVAIDDRRKSFPSDELLKCRMSGINIIEPVSFIEREKGKVNISLLKPSWFIFSETHKETLFQRLCKRGFDTFFSLIILTLLAPILMLVCVLIWLESGAKGPIFYQQLRVGKEGKVFSLYKFRSMCINAEKNGQAIWAQANDQRITTIGRFIRRTRIDELPQILNILKGDMSLVGPRPERPEFVDELSESIPFYCHRHSVKPGLAGWAQLKYSYGSCHRDAIEKLQYDLFYVKNRSLLMDVMILLQTLDIVILGKGCR